MPADHVIVSSTTDSEGAARDLASGVISAHLGACAHIVGPITSVYRWEGEVQTDQEWRVEVKTAADQVAALTDHIKAHHSYDVPEIIATPITGGSTEYLAWLVAETRVLGEPVMDPGRLVPPATPRGPGLETTADNSFCSGS
jgi:periplasmic divalent cation tolerance protein